MRREIAPEWRACVGSPYRMSTGQFCPRRCMARLVGPNRIQLGLSSITVLLGCQPRPLELDLPDVPGSAVPTPCYFFCFRPRRFRIYPASPLSINLPGITQLFSPFPLFLPFLLPLTPP